MSTAVFTDTIRVFDNVLPQYRTSFDGTIIDANSALLELLGYPTLADLKKKDVLDLYVDKGARDKWLATVLEHGKTDMLVQYKRKGAGPVWVRDIAALPKIQDIQNVGAEPPVNEVVGFLIPVDKGENLRRYHEKLMRTCDELFDQAKVGIIKLDRECRIIYANNNLRQTSLHLKTL